jgi:hypothetical protein
MVVTNIAISLQIAGVGLVVLGSISNSLVTSDVFELFGGKCLHNLALSLSTDYP